MEDIGTGSNVRGTTWMQATGKDKKAAANKKRKEFYETEEGIAKKKYYADKAREKYDLIRQLKKLKTSRNDAELTKETIAKLMDLL